MSSRPEDPLELLARSWDASAYGYDQYYVPRFAPWIADLVAAVAAAELPGGSVAVPCCGTAPEIAGLLAALPDRPIVGIDLSPEMIRLARLRYLSEARVTFEVGDASVPTPRWRPPCAAVVSAFGLQLLDVAAGRWLGALAPGGVLAAVYWTPDSEEQGPFALLRDVFRERLPPPDRSWETRLPAVIAEAGGQILRHELVAHPMSHPSARALWAANADSGTWRVLAETRGEDFMREAREAFLAVAPKGPIEHRPRAKFLVARAPGLDHRPKSG